MVALIFSLISLLCFVICFFGTKEVIGGGKRRQEDRFSFWGQLKILGKSFKALFTEKNTAILILEMFFFLTGIFGRLGIMYYYFRYVLGDMIAIASFGIAMSTSMLLSNFYAPYLLKITLTKRRWQLCLPS